MDQETLDKILRIDHDVKKRLGGRVGELLEVVLDNVDEARTFKGKSIARIRISTANDVGGYTYLVRGVKPAPHNGGSVYPILERNVVYID